MKVGILFFCIILFFSCRDKFDIPDSSSLNNVLVIEGQINSGVGTASVSVSRSSSLGESVRFIGESGAVVALETENNDLVRIFSSSPVAGVYETEDLNLDMNRKYHLRITSSDGRAYISDPLTIEQNFPIDNISYDYNPEGVEISVTTIAQSNEPKYFLWTYNETWEIQAPLYSTLLYAGGIVRDRQPYEETFRCWKNAISSTINIGTTQQLNQSIINEKSLLFIRRASERLGIRYSILVNQFAISRNHYAFLELMKKNTESIGTIFDPQPSELRGNVKSVSNPDELVVGFVSLSNLEKKRMFINSSDLISWGYFNARCDIDTVANNAAALAERLGQHGLVPVQPIFGAGPGGIDAYEAALPSCTDCRNMGGDLLRPDFW